MNEYKNYELKSTNYIFHIKLKKTNLDLLVTHENDIDRNYSIYENVFGQFQRNIIYMTPPFVHVYLLPKHSS